MFQFVSLVLVLALVHTSLSQNEESLILEQLKLTLDDPDNLLSNWNTQLNPNPCSWYGISCSDSASNSVNSVDLSNCNIAGAFPLSLCRLTNLTSITLYNNSFNSTIPDEVSTCKNLQHLDLSQNYLTGKIPATLGDISDLRYLDLAGNNFSGEIPVSFGLFEKLEVFSVIENLLDGSVPSFLGNITSLKQLNLSYNLFNPGRIPPEIGNLTELEILWMTGCNLIGEIPDSLGKLSRLVDLDLSLNSLEGSIPISLTRLTSVVQIELYNNTLSGEFPIGMSNMTALRRLDASMNQLVGNIPDELCQLPLESLNLYENLFSGNLPVSIAKSPNLYELRLFLNQLTGELPNNLGANSPLLWLDVSDNQFTGEIPPNLCEKGQLQELLLIKNLFTGPIPNSLGLCMSLRRIRLGNNRFSGEVPTGIWGLPYVYFLELADNSFSGQIAKTIGGASNLSRLVISRNNLTGNIPDEIGDLDNLLEFSSSNNMLTGPIPVTVMKLNQLGIVDLHDNYLTGKLSSEIKSMMKLNELNLANNKLSGKIPEEIGSLSVLNYLDLSGNRLSGKIPLELQNLKLNKLNLSNNHLSGDIPPLYAKQIYKNSFLGNPGLCGDLEGLCDSKSESKNQGFMWLLRSIFILAGLLFLAGVVWFSWKYINFKKSKRANNKSKWTLTSFHKLDFNEFEILDGLDEDNVIGTGLSGKVYKAVLSSGETVAVKKLWKNTKMVEDDNTNNNSNVDDVDEDNDGFEPEVETLGKIRHKNIVKLWCSCSTKDCKLLVYEYMPNGSLGDLLHGSKSGLLVWPIRFKIALDAAEGLSYLHHDCVPPIVHRDVKSNNILLDSDFGARVADFGVAKVVDSTGEGIKSMSGITGSCGYIAPEYAYTLRVNEKSDIYSFGVVILELITGRLPNDLEFGEKDIVKWVCTSLDQKGVDNILDSKLDPCYKEEICTVLNIGLICTSPLPINRPSMRRVVKMLQEVGGEKQLKTITKDGKLSPYYYEDSIQT